MKLMRGLAALLLLALAQTPQVPPGEPPSPGPSEQLPEAQEELILQLEARIGELEKALAAGIEADRQAAEAAEKERAELEGRLAGLEQEAATREEADRQVAQSRERRLTGLGESIQLLETAWTLLLGGNFEAQGPLDSAVSILASTQAEATSLGGVEEAGQVDQALAQAFAGAEALRQREFLGAMLAVENALRAATQARQSAQASQTSASF